MTVSEAAKETPVQRAEALLRSRLSDEQRADYLATGAFTVTTPGGRRYRLHKHRTTYQADLLAKEGSMVLARYCVASRTQKEPRADVLLAQKLLLETDEAGFLLLANEDLQVVEPYPWTTGERRQAPSRPEPQHEPDYYNPPGRDLSAYRAQFQQNDRNQRIWETVHCFDHNNRARAVEPNLSGRGVVLWFDCGCPELYVDYRRWEQQQRQAVTTTAQIEAAIERLATPNVLMRAYEQNQWWRDLSERFPCPHDSCALRSEREADDGRGYHLAYECGFRRFVSYHVIREEEP